MIGPKRDGKYESQCGIINGRDLICMIPLVFYIPNPRRTLTGDTDTHTQDSSRAAAAHVMIKHIKSDNLIAASLATSFFSRPFETNQKIIPR